MGHFFSFFSEINLVSQHTFIKKFSTLVWKREFRSEIEVEVCAWAKAFAEKQNTVMRNVMTIIVYQKQVYHIDILKYTYLWPATGTSNNEDLIP